MMNNTHVYIYIYIYLYIHTHIHTYKHIHNIYTYIHVYIRTYNCLYTVHCMCYQGPVTFGRYDELRGVIGNITSHRNGNIYMEEPPRYQLLLLLINFVINVFLVMSMITLIICSTRIIIAALNHFIRRGLRSHVFVRFVVLEWLCMCFATTAWTRSGHEHLNDGQQLLHYTMYSTAYDYHGWHLP